MNETYNLVFNKIAIYILTAILASLVLGGLLGLVETFIFTDSWGFFPTTFVVALYTLPIFCILAVPFSILVDYATKTRKLSAFKKLLLYIVAGISVGFAYGTFLLVGPHSNPIEYVWPSIYGAVGAAVFFGLIEWLKKWK